jgi:anti-sigma factor RsiW
MATDPKSGYGACPEHEALWEDYIGGDLSSADAGRAEEHLGGCAACREALEMAAASRRLLRTVEPAEDPGPGFARLVMARIHTAQQERSSERAGFWQPFVWLGWRFAVTATLALGLLVTYDARQPQPDVASARPIVRDLFSPDPARTLPVSGDETLMMVADTSHANY